MASTGSLSSNLNHLINTYNNQLANKESNKSTPAIYQSQPIIACTAPVQDNLSLNEMTAKVANITLSTTDNNNNMMTTPLVTVGSPLSGSRRKSSTGSYSNLPKSATTSPSRPTNLLRSAESSPEQGPDANQSGNSSNLLSVNTSGMKSRRYSDNSINVPKIEIAPR